MQKKFQRILFGFISFIFVLLLNTGIPAHTRETPYRLMGYVIVPDLGSTIDTIEKLAIEIDPVRFMPNILRMQAGMLIGDPGLQNIDPERPIVAMVFYKPETEASMRKNRPQVAVFIPVKNKDLAEKMIPRIKFPSVQNDDMIILSANPPLLSYAKNKVNFYNDLSKVQLKSNARFTVKIDTINEVFASQMDDLLKKIQMNMDKKGSISATNSKKNEFVPGLSKILMYSIFDIIKQSKDYQLDVTINENALTFETEHSAVPDTALSLFFDATAPDKNKCLSLLPESRHLIYGGYYDIKKTKSFIESLLNGVIKREPGIRNNIEEGIISAYLKSLDLYLGEVAFQYGFAGDGKLQANFAFTTEKTEKEFLEMQNDFEKIYSALYSNSDIGFKEYKFLKNVRSFKGVNIHTTSLKTGLTTAPHSKEGDLVRKIIGDEIVTEYAISGGFIIGSTDQKRLDMMIDNSLSGSKDVTLEAMKSFGPAMDSYMDIKIIDLVEQIIRSVAPQFHDERANDKVDGFFKVLADLKPEDRLILTTGKYRKGVSYGKYQVSTSMITEVMKFFTQSRKPVPLKQPGAAVE